MTDAIIVRGKDGRFLPGTKSPKPITAELSHEYRQRRQQKTAALLRQRIRETHNGVMPSPVTTASEAIAEAGAMLYEQVVLNSEAYPRDRRETWKDLAIYSETIPADVRAASAPPQNVTNILAISDTAAAALAAALARIPALGAHADTQTEDTAEETE